MKHKCSKCGSDHITSDKIRFDGADVVIVPMSCNECFHYWDAIFRFERNKDKED